MAGLFSSNASATLCFPKGQRHLYLLTTGSSGTGKSCVKGFHLERKTVHTFCTATDSMIVCLVIITALNLLLPFI